MDFWELVALIFCGRGGDGRSPRCDQVATFDLKNSGLAWSNTAQGVE